MRNRRAGFKLIEVATAGVLVGLVMAVGLPNYIKAKDRASEAEAKERLHEIQLHVERFAVDTEGTYPQYLIGGSPGQTIEHTSDPLLRKGYLKAYPQNPFYRESGAEVLAYQKLLPDSTVYQSDPLMPGTQTATASGYRFGRKGRLMGSVLADPRFTTWIYADAATGKTQSMQSYADVEYDFWDTERPAGGTNDYLPGEFFYKGLGPIVYVPSNALFTGPKLPTEIDSYMLGAYGGLKNPGKDVLGPEREFQCKFVSGKSYLPGIGTRIQENIQILWPWTRSQVGKPAALEGSPFSPANPRHTSEQSQYGNPNGIRDSIILVVTAGEGYEGENERGK